MASRRAIGLLVGAAGRLDLLQRGGGQLDRGVQGQRRELLALGLLRPISACCSANSRRLRIRSSGSPPNGKAFHAARLAQRQLVAALDVARRAPRRCRRRP